jgi:purine nucleoside phosphorylase
VKPWSAQIVPSPAVQRRDLPIAETQGASAMTGQSSEGRIAVIGGSGFYDFPDLEERKEERVSTPFGDPSNAIVTGRIAGRPVAFLPRHGRGHRINPSELPSRANIYALKVLGVDHIISVSACGSMREEIAPLDVVIPDQLLDSARVVGQALSSKTASLHTSPSRTRSAAISARRCSAPPLLSALGSMPAARTFAWRGQPSPRVPSRAPIASGA